MSLNSIALIMLHLCGSVSHAIEDCKLICNQRQSRKGHPPLRHLSQTGYNHMTIIYQPFLKHLFNRNQRSFGTSMKNQNISPIIYFFNHVDIEQPCIN